MFYGFGFNLRQDFLHKGQSKIIIVLWWPSRSATSLHGQNEFIN